MKTTTALTFLTFLMVSNDLLSMETLFKAQIFPNEDVTHGTYNPTNYTTELSGENDLSIYGRFNIDPINCGKGKESALIVVKSFRKSLTYGLLAHHPGNLKEKISLIEMATHFFYEPNDIKGSIKIILETFGCFKKGELISIEMKKFLKIVGDYRKISDKNNPSIYGRFNIDPINCGEDEKNKKSALSILESFIESDIYKDLTTCSKEERLGWYLVAKHNDYFLQGEGVSNIGIMEALKILGYEKNSGCIMLTMRKFIYSDLKITKTIMNANNRTTTH